VEENPPVIVDRAPSMLTSDELRLESERTRRYMTMLIERQTLKIQALIDAIEFMKYIDS
jgi:hypothetical protein